MSQLNSWEDDPAAQDDNLAQQAQQQLNINPNASSFRPSAQSFQPSAQSFQPGQPYQQYGYQQQQQQQQQYNQYYGNHGYQQYGQQQGYEQFYPQQSGYNQAYGTQYGNYPPQQNYQNRGQNQQQPRVQIAKRPTGSTAPAPAGTTVSPAAPAAPASSDAAAPGAKVLSIGGDGAPKAKVLSIGATTTTAKTTPTPAPSGNAPPAKPEVKKEPTAKDAAKTLASKAVEKTEKRNAAKTGTSSPTPGSGKSSPSPAEVRAARQEADAVTIAQQADVDEETLQEFYGKEHMNIIFIGHVDAGKSTLGGSILYLTGMVDERTMDKYKREAKEAGRETWYLSWALDLTKEERAKGKTVEIGRGFFETGKRRYTILDAPGHKTFVPEMIGGASQADVGILVISARKGEYETGFERGGQTREHAVLAKTQGVNKLVVAINKMDDITVEWSKARFDECTSKLGNFLKGCGYNLKNDVFMMPLSAQTGVGIKERVPKDVAPWWDGPSLLEYLDSMKTLERKIKAPFMMPISGKYRDMGTIIEGKIEAGVVKKGMSLLMMPNREEIQVGTLYGETEDEVPTAVCGDQVRARIRGIEEEDILPGYVLCSPKRPVHCVSAFEAQIVLLELKTILSAGFNCVLHVHAAIEEVTFSALLHKLEKGTGRKSRKAPAFASKGQSIIARLEIISGAGAVCVEKFEDYPQLGRFTLRDQGQTIAIGKITKLITDTDPNGTPTA